MANEKEALCGIRRVRRGIREIKIWHLAQPARTEDQRPGTHLIFSNGTEMFVWENMSEFIPAAYR